MILSRTRCLAVVALAALLLAACAGDQGGGGEGQEQGSQQGGQQDAFVVEVASYDLAAGRPTRFIAGLVAGEGRLVAYGTVQMRFAFLGTQQPKQVAEAAPSISATASFLPIPGSPPADSRQGPVEVAPSEGRGVYATTVTFDRPGYWGLQVIAELQGKGQRSATTVFQVRDSHQVPAVGDRALRTRNHTLSSKDVPKAAIDSRAQVDEGKIPDPQLHQLTIADAIAKRKPTVVVFSTPVYCVSQFCGPVTEVVAGLAEEYGDRASFIHVEIWRDYEKREINKAAADWLLRGGNLNEPWVFVIGADGRITARFDNVATEDEVRKALDEALKAT